MSEPEAFFRRLPLEGGLEAPLTFAAFNFLAGGLGYMIFGGGVLGLIGFVISALVSLAIFPGLAMLVATRLFEGRGDYEATFRAVAYASAPMVAAGLPLLKWVAALYALYLAILGIARAHEIDTVRATMTVLVTKAGGAFLVWGLGLWGLATAASPYLD